MTNVTICPVPIEQRPIHEFKELSQSWFFGMPLTNLTKFYRFLIFSWIIFISISILIETGSFYLRNNPTDLILASLLIGLALPILLLTRQILGWNYLLKRLVSEKIEYEESGWYDGQCWEKPLEWREKDLLIAQHEIKPVIRKLSTSLLCITALGIAMSMAMVLKPN